MRDSKPVLLVEDDNIDAMTVKRALKDLKVTNPLVHKLNGEEALEYLKCKNNKKYFHRRLHRLLAHVFIPKTNNKHNIVNHIDKNTFCFIASSLAKS